MAMMRLPKDFKEFLSLLNSTGVDFLLVSGYAVAWHGYPRATGDLNVWVAVSENNARRLVSALKQFGFNIPQLCPDIFPGAEQGDSDGATAFPDRDHHVRLRLPV